MAWSFSRSLVVSFHEKLLLPIVPADRPRHYKEFYLGSNLKNPCNSVAGMLVRTTLDDAPGELYFLERLMLKS